MLSDEKRCKVFYKKDLQAAGDAAAIAAYESLRGSEFDRQLSPCSPNDKVGSSWKDAMRGKRVFSIVGVLTSLAPVAIRRDWYRAKRHPKAGVGRPKRLVLAQ